MSSRYVTIQRAADLTGYTVRAIQTKIDRGVWLCGRVWVHAPDGRILIDMQGYEEWATSDFEASKRTVASSACTSRGMVA